MILTLDIGGTNIRGVIFENSKRIKSFKFQTSPSDFDINVSNIKKEISGLKIDIISIGMPGPANYKKGIFLTPPNLKGWWNKNLKEELKDICDVNRIVCENDAKLMALSNHKDIGGNDQSITQFFTISTGIGAGLIINNEIYNGFSGTAQEVAHVPVNTIDEENRYSKGAVEYFSSGSGIEARAKGIGMSSAREVFENYKNNAEAKKIIDVAIEGLANLVAATVALINPSDIVFDGSVARNNKWFIDSAITIAKSRMYEAQAKSFKYHISRLGDDSVLLGALERAKYVK